MDFMILGEQNLGHRRFGVSKVEIDIDARILYVCKVSEGIFIST